MKEQIIKKLNYTLTRSDYVSFGLVSDSLVFGELKDDWITYNRHIVPPMKVKNYSKDRNVLDGRNYYTDEELEEILDEQIWLN